MQLVPLLTSCLCGHSNGVLECAPFSDSIMLLGDFNAHVINGTEPDWCIVIGLLYKPQFVQTLCSNISISISARGTKTPNIAGQ